MRLEDLTIVLRPRQPWEAADLGCTLVRRDYARLLLLWGITVLPLWAGLAVLMRDYPIWFGLAAWWLKPLYDRVPLFYLSQAAFGAKPTLRQTLRAWPRLWSRFLLSALIFRRLSFKRSFALPVWMLEGQRGAAVRKRVKALAFDGGSSGAWVTAVFVHLELAVWLGLMALVSTLGPSSGLPNWGELFVDPEGFFEMSQAQLWFNNVLYLAAMTMIEPFYVGAGFGLYLNSRIKLEGWDIELTFRRLAARLTQAAAVLLCLLFLLPASSPAQEAGVAAEEKVETVLKEILAQPEFKEHSRTQRIWVPDETKVQSNTGDVRWMGVLFYIAAGAAVAFLLFLAVRWLIQNKHLFGLPAARARRAAALPGPRVVMGMEIARESLPDDIVAAARAAWAAGHAREALSLLYRGSLSRLVEQRRLPIRASDTEDDCLMKTADLADIPLTEFFRPLTLAWVRAAYAGQEAQAHEFEELCRTWPFAEQQHPARQQPRTRPAAVSSAAVLMLSALPLLTGCKGHWEDVTIPLGYRGEARTDPFLAARQLLEEFGHETERKPALTQFPESSRGVIVVSGESGMPEARARQLLEWAEDGGHVVYALAGCAPYNDWGMFGGLTTFAYAGNEDRTDPVLEKLKVKTDGSKGLDSIKETFKKMAEKDKADKEKDKKKETPKPAPGEVIQRIQQPEDLPTSRSQMVLGSETFEVGFPALQTLSLERPLRRGEYIAGSVEEATVLSLVHGAGRVTVITHARPLRNRYLDESDHARWLLALVGRGSHEVHFIATLQSSFWELLWRRAWMPLVGLALVTIVWLWRNMPRFGPLQKVELHETKHFADHIAALGQFFHRLKRPDILLGAAADAVRARALRKHPHLVHQDDEALVDFLAEHSPLPKERIRAAFVSSGKAASHEVVRRLQDLQSLKMALE